MKAIFSFGTNNGSTYCEYFLYILLSRSGFMGKKQGNGMVVVVGGGEINCIIPALGSG